ncbi:MAG: hypothetical protein QM636_19955, partial [Rhizobium sp.]
LRRPQSHAGLRTPEIRPLHKSYPIAAASKTEIRLNRDPCTNVYLQTNRLSRHRSPRSSVVTEISAVPA